MKKKKFETCTHYYFLQSNQKKIKRLMTVNGSNLFEKTKKKSINFSPPKHLNHHQLLLLKKKRFTTFKKWLKINYLFYQHLSGVTIFLWKQQKTKYYYYKTTTTNYFFCFLKWSKTSIVRIARPSPSKNQQPHVFFGPFFLLGKKDSYAAMISFFYKLF